LIRRLLETGVKQEGTVAALVFSIAGCAQDQPAGEHTLLVSAFQMRR